MWSRMPFGETLRAELGSPKRSQRLGSSPRSRVWRVELPGGQAVVKQVVGGTDAERRYAREVAALRLAVSADPPAAPALLGVDSTDRVLVLEYLEHRDPPADWIVAYATALARLHAIGATDQGDILPAWTGPTQDDIGSFLGLADELGVSVPGDVSAELTELTDRLNRAPRNALLHGDPCPGNDLHTPNGVRFVDFEQAALGNGLVELAYLRIGFPTCWCSTMPPQHLVVRAESAYRTTWTRTTGTDLGGDLTDLCVGWLLLGDALVERAHRQTVDQLARVPHSDWTWGTATARQRLVHRLGVVAHMAANRDDLAGMRRLSGRMRQRMLIRWPTLPALPSNRP